MDVLGCTIAATPTGISWQLAQEKATEWVDCMRGILCEQKLSAGQASKLVGRLGFASYRVFGRIGRAYIRPIMWQKLYGRRQSLGARLQAAPNWWIQMLQQYGVRHHDWALLSCCQPDVLLYSDADGKGGIGAYVVWRATAKVEFASSSVPCKWLKSLKARRVQINAYEMLAMLAAWATWGTELRNQRIHCFVDNKSALDIFIAGWSKHADLNWVAGACWLQMASVSASVHWSWVPSGANPADAPSRGIVELKNATRRAMRWPRPPPSWNLGT